MTGDVRFSYAKAHELLWKLGYWKYLLAPIALSILLALVLLSLCWIFAASLGGWIQQSLNEVFQLPDWLRIPLLIILFIVGLGPCYVAFRSLVMVCYGPWLDQLSVKAEILINGHSKEVDRSIWESIKRPLAMAVLTISAAIGAFFGGMVIGLIPLIGALLAGVVVPLIELFLSAVGYIDPYCERTGLTPTQSFAILRANAVGVICFALVGLLITLIPFIGWFVGPTYSVVAGVIYGILLTNARPTSTSA
ncbi:EI24 domain-containing protein [Cerasicoccus arenae]|uniref:CysZ protein n=1 Tax=Cerasicoccus arenae TaxID=424488 RepID=A0A8J3GCJ7_9BACT|nr:EI24 domain-containing protein [Cerasicoccus arenae]MBK1856949.1 EI24 domain-containing protein [Cerasicoccus arenae]GHB89996.1 hypothetical protein GCM10007047_00730 [Cerasicoccus arenae]